MKPQEMVEELVDRELQTYLHGWHFFRFREQHSTVVATVHESTGIMERIMILSLVRQKSAF